jgi:hypothetical protein
MKLSKPVAILVPCFVAALGNHAAADRDSSLTARSGATFGVGVGGGNLGCRDSDGADCDGDDANSAGGISVHAGFLLSPRLALSGELWGMAHTDDRFTITQGIAAAVLRGWVSKRVWLQGGFGVARSTAEVDLGDLGGIMSETDYVPAATLGVGAEVLSTENLAVEIELKGGSGLYESDIQIYNLSLGAAVSFY